MQEHIITYDPLSDYRLILDLPPAIKSRIAHVKAGFDQDYKGLPIAGGSAFIYLAEFIQRESQEISMIDQLNRVALGFMPFKLHLKNFDQMGESEIYIKPMEAKAIQTLVAQIEGISNYLPEIRLNKIPRVTIARGLQPFQFLKSWKEYAEKKFAATFIVHEMILLKRMEGFSSWQILRRLAFQNIVLTH